MTQLEQNFFEAATRWFRKPEPVDVDWEQRRYEIAKDALVGLLAAPVIPGVNPCPPISDTVELAIDYADALIEELKK